MKTSVVAVALLALLPLTGSACQMQRPPEFQLRATTRASNSPPRLKVRSVHFVPYIVSGTSCDGLGFITIELSAASCDDITRYGVFIREQDGGNDTEWLPSYPIAPERAQDGATILRWGWGAISADDDGEVRKQLELVPVSRSGALGAPIPLCVASDDSCPALESDRPQVRNAVVDSVATPSR